MPDWVPSELIGNWNDTDIDYRFCMDLFAKLEAAKRDNFPKETMRIWFIEFLKRGWNKRMVIERYEALLGTKIYGTEKIDFADWVNAVPVYAQDEVNLMVERKINARIQKGMVFLNKILPKINKLFQPAIELSEEDKKNIAIAALEKVKSECEAERFRMIDDEIEKQKKHHREVILVKREKIKSYSQETKRNLLERLIADGILKIGNEYEYTLALSYLEFYAEQIPEDYLR